MEDSTLSEELGMKSTSSSSFLQKTLSGIKTALLGTLFVMAKDSSLSFKMNLLGMVIDWLQLLAFPFNLGSLYPWNQSYSNWFAMLCYYSKLEFYISPTNSTQNLVIYLVCVLLVFGNLVNACIVGYRFVKKKVQSVFLLKMLRSVASLLTTVFYMPFLSQFAIMFSCAIGRLNFEGCPLEQKWLLITVSPLISVMFGFLSIIVAASFYEQDYTSDDVSARPHARVELFYLVLKGVITVFYSLFDAPEYHFYQIFMILIVGVPVTFCYIYYLPYYHYLTTVIQAQFVGSFTWAGFCLLLCRLGNDPDDAGSIMLFFVGTPCIFYIIKEACDWRREQLVNKTIDTIRSPYEVELHTRFLLLQNAGSYKTSDEALLTKAEDFYYLAERRFPDSSILKLFVAQFHLTYRNRQEAIPKLEQAEKRNPALDEQFIIYKTRQSVGKDAIVFVTFSSYLDSAHRGEIASLEAQQEFWGELKAGNSLNFNKLVSLSRVITKNIDIATNYYKYLMNIDRTHRKMLPMHVYFLEDVLMRNDYEVKNLRNRVQDMRNSEDTGKSSAASRLVLALKPEVCVSLDKGLFSLIENVSSGMVIWLQLPKARLMNQPLLHFMPPCLHYAFRRYCEEQQELYDENARLPKVELHFLDKDGHLLIADCSAELLVEDLSKFRKVQTAESPPKPDLGGNKRVPCMNILKKRLNLVLRPQHSGNSCLIIDASFRILHVNGPAECTFGINFQLQASYNLRDFIPNFESLMTKILKRSTLTDDYLETFSSAQTFILSRSGEFIRIKVSAKAVTTPVEKLYIIEIQKLSSYSQQTQKFFQYFIGFLETYLEQLTPVDLSRRIMMNSLHPKGYSDPEEVSDIKSLMKHVKTQVETKNKSHSPELRRVRQLFLGFIVLLTGSFVFSFMTTDTAFTKYTNTLYQINSCTDIQAYSLLLAELVRLLDAVRQGLSLPYTTESYYAKVLDTIETLDSLVDNVSEHSGLDEISDKSVLCVEYSTFEGYTLKAYTPLEALIRQLSYSQRLVEGPLEDWDIATNSYAFWVYENGMGSLRQALDEFTVDLLCRVEKQRQEVEHWALIAAIVECVLCLAIVVTTYPLLMKSDRSQFDILSVFASIPGYLLRYLQLYAENALKMRQDHHYPDCRPKYKTQKELWEDCAFEKESQSSTSKASTMHAHSCLQRMCRVTTQLLTRRILLFVFISLVFILVLQLWLSQLYVLQQLSNSRYLVKDIGSLSIILTEANLNAMNVILSPYQVNVVNITSDYIYHPSSFSSSYQATFIQTHALRKQLRVFLVGNEEVPYSYMYPVQVENFFDDFFHTDCHDLDECESSKPVHTLPLVWAMASYCFDLELVCNILAAEPELTVNERWQLVTAEASEALLEKSTVWTLNRYAETQVISYYIHILEKYNRIRTAVLIGFCVVAVLYYFFFFHRGLLETAKKEQLTRNMLLLLPETIVTHSPQVQSALLNLHFD